MDDANDASADPFWCCAIVWAPERPFDTLPERRFVVHTEAETLPYQVEIDIVVQTTFRLSHRIDKIVDTRYLNVPIHVGQLAEQVDEIIHRFESV